MKLLIVDDSTLMQKSITKFLGQYLSDVEFHVASDGIKGWEMFQEIRPDVMTIDLLMPKRNGLELLHLLAQEEHSTRLFVLSADVQRSVHQEVENLGAIFISKPFTLEKAEELAQLIKEYGVC